LDRSHARQGFEQTHLPEEIASPNLGQLDFILGSECLDHACGPGQQEVKLIAGLAFADDDLARWNLESHGLAQQSTQGCLVKAGKDGDLLERFQREIGGFALCVNHVSE
jgi:hypothetical protein